MRVIGNNPDIQDSEVRFVASGALTDGSTVVLNSDGTVSVVSETAVSQSQGSPVVFETGDTESTATVYDPSAQKVVVFYRDMYNSSYGTAVVGTVSGTSISFGTAVVFESAQSRNFSATYDPNSQKLVTAYRDDGNSSFGTAIVGTVSGTSISFGSAAVFESATCSDFAATYDTNAQKVVIAYRDNDNLGYGTAVVGTVSGTSISFGSPVVFESGATNYVEAVYDSSAQKVVVAYRDEANSYYGTAIVGTVSGTSISFGSPTVFESANAYNISATYNSNAQKVVIIYSDFGNGSYGTGIVGTVSGTSISFGSPTVFYSGTTTQITSSYDANAQKTVIAYRDEQNPSETYGRIVPADVSGTSISYGTTATFRSGNVDFTSSAYDANAQKVVVVYRDRPNADKGTALVFQAGYTTTNLTADNFIGFSKGVFSDAENATIFTGGAVSDRQTSLTPAQTYYVQTDGSLSTTAGDPSVLAGTAISNTDIIVKG